MAVRASDGGLAGWIAALTVPASAVGSPVYIEASEPAVVRRIVELTPDTADGRQTEVIVVSAEGGAMETALAAAGADDPLRLARVRVMTGASAGQDLLASLITPERLDVQVQGACLVQPGLARRVIAGAALGVEGIVGAAMRQQQRVLEQLGAKNSAVYGPRTKAWWAARYSDVRAGRGERLRALLVTTRYSTFVKHSTADMAQALEQMGCEARILIEPDERSKLTSVAYARAIAEYAPDVLLVVNYTRMNLPAAPAIPTNLPIVCWIQDAMQHLMDARVGAGLGTLDFTIGHAHPELFTQFGYSAARALALPVPVSSVKFHASAVSESDRARFTCDIAYVGHQSEAPLAMRDRLIDEARAAGAGNAIAPIIERLYPALVTIAEAPLGVRVHPAIADATREAIREVTRREAEPALLTVVLNTVARPLADRIMRHQTLAWAAEIAAARGLRLHVYGRGWLAHPVLGGFARGEVTHDESLRACYQMAACHLHATTATGVHQRVLECALSGGVPLCRLKMDDLETIWAASAVSIMARGGADMSHWPDRYPGASLTDHPESLAFLHLRQRLGLREALFLRLFEGGGVLGRNADIMTHPEVAWLIGDPAESMFSTREGLERAVMKAAERGEWREQVSQGIAGRAARHLTYDAVARRVVQFVGDGLGAV